MVVDGVLHPQMTLVAVGLGLKPPSNWTAVIVEVVELAVDTLPAPHHIDPLVNVLLFSFIHPISININLAKVDNS